MAKAKAPAAFTITLSFTQAQLNKIASGVVSCIADDYDTATIKAAGYNVKDLVQAVTEDKGFRKEIEDEFKEHLEGLIHNPYDYDIGYDTKIIQKALSDIEKIMDAQDKKDALAGRAFAAPRSWSFVSELLDDDDVSDRTLTDLVAGAVGEGLAVKFTVSVPSK